MNNAKITGNAYVAIYLIMKEQIKFYKPTTLLQFCILFNATKAEGFNGCL